MSANPEAPFSTSSVSSRGGTAVVGGSAALGGTAVLGGTAAQARGKFNSPSPVPLLAVALAGGLMVIEATRSGADTPADAADALLSALLGGLLPLVSALLLLPYGPEPQRLAIRLGQNRSRRLLARVLRVSLWVTILFTGLAAFGLGRARGLHSPLLPLDLLATVPATALGALTTCLFFSAVRMHLGRWGVLIGLALTWTFGQAELAASAALPSGHLRHLLNLSGDALPLPLWGSSLSLLAFALLSIGAILLRARR